MVNRQLGERQRGDIDNRRSMRKNFRDRGPGLRKMRLDERSQCVTRCHAGRYLLEINWRPLATQLHHVFAISSADLPRQSDYPEAGQFFRSTVAETASARRRGQVGTNSQPSGDYLRWIDRHGARNCDRGSLDQVQFSKRPAFADACHNRRQVGRKPALALELAREQLAVVNQPVALLRELIEPTQVFPAIDLGHQRSAFRYCLCRGVICLRQSFAAGKIDHDPASFTGRLRQFDGAITPRLERARDRCTEAKGSRVENDRTTQTNHVAEEPRRYPLASAATSASVMNGPAAPDAARYRGSQTGRNLFLKLRRP